MTIHYIQQPNPEPGGFIDDLHIVTHSVPIKERPFELTRAFRYHSKILGRIITVQAGYRTDFASIPRIFWRILNPVGQYSHAAVVHDWLCDRRGSTGVDSKTTHAIFREAMEVLKVPGWKRATMYLTVRWFGPRFSSSQSDQTDPTD